MGTFHTGPLIDFLMMEPQERRNLIGQEIREARLAHGVSQSAFASGIGYAQAYVANVESGRKSPSPAMVKSIVEYFEKEGIHAPGQRPTQED